MAMAYEFTGEQVFRDMMKEITWWGMSRVWKGAPKYAQGETPQYAWISRNTKGDWISPTALVFGVAGNPRQDTQAPAQIADLKARTAGGKVQLSWSAPRDTGGSKLAAYQVKWSKKPIKDFMDVNWIEEGKTVTYWNMAHNIAGEPVPGSAGKKEQMTVALKPGKLFVAVRSMDGESNRSKISNLAEVNVK